MPVIRWDLPRLKSVSALCKSHINQLRDGVRFFLILFKIGILYSPLKVYFPLALLLADLVVFLIGLVLVIGGGMLDINAARVAMGMGADLTLLDRERTNWT